MILTTTPAIEGKRAVKDLGLGSGDTSPGASIQMISVSGTAVVLESQ